MDIRKQIKESTDIEYLKELDKYVDMDIKNIGTDSDVIKKIKAEMRNTTIEEMEKQSLDGFNDIKERIKSRISELS
jgi:hypothetical protein